MAMVQSRSGGLFRQLEDGTARVLSRDQSGFLKCAYCHVGITSDDFVELVGGKRPGMAALMKDVKDGDVLCANCARPLPTPEDLKAAAARDLALGGQELQKSTTANGVPARALPWPKEK